MAKLLEVSELSVAFEDAQQGPAAAVLRGLSFELGVGHALAVVGESGSGKTSLSLALTRLLPSNARVGGRALLLGDDLLTVDSQRLSQLRGAEIGLVFQHPGSALDPVMRVTGQIAEVCRTHGASRAEATARARSLLEEVGLGGLPAATYPHQLSGGMQQRVMLAVALAAKPSLLIADEPTTALDVVTEREIFALLDTLRAGRGLALLLITHDLGLARHCDEVLVLHGGEIVELGPTAAVLKQPAHPYTRALIAAAPRLDRAPAPLSGLAPAPTDEQQGCRFAPRCPEAEHRCRQRAPQLLEYPTLGRRVRCHLLADEHAGAEPPA
jgi:oligopeptide/dipeptide ABC transporter ATP-binding protein